MNEPEPIYSGSVPTHYGAEVKVYGNGLIYVTQVSHPDSSSDAEFAFTPGEARQLIRLLKEAIKAAN